MTPGSRGAPFWATAAGLSRWKISLFVHLAPPWQEAQLAAKTVSPGLHIAGLGLFQRPHGGKDPQGLRVEGLAGTLGDAVVVDGGIHRRFYVTIGEDRLIRRR